MKRGFSLLAAVAAGALLSQLLQRVKPRRHVPPAAESADASIPQSESSATRFRDNPGFAQEDADQEPL